MYTTQNAQRAKMEGEFTISTVYSSQRYHAPVAYRPWHKPASGEFAVDRQVPAYRCDVTINVTKKTCFNAGNVFGVSGEVFSDWKFIGK